MTLENLYKSKALQKEPPDKREFDGLLQTAIDRLNDAENTDLSYASRFDLAYNAAHALALAALRSAGYRSDKRYLVFQCLAHTCNLRKSRIRTFSLCHDRRNRAEYGGYLEQDEALLLELIANTQSLLKSVRSINL
ncbi:MAG: hypothetical protein AB2657_15925 [Candidatus Thiodiazotropha endolucinida]|uniref:hypothetical protein n=1 Tax=Candidatus Thiodiazotropha sp. LNASS1 TaxID=3096260 RepID=UPI003483B419